MLSREGHGVVVVDQSEAALDNVRRYLDVKTVLGSGSNPRVLREAEAPSADLLIAFTVSDEINMVACLLAKALGTKRTVARVRNPEYTGYLVTDAKSPVGRRRVITPQTLGLGLFVNPDIMAAEEIVGVLSSLYTTSLEEFAEGRVQVREFTAESEAMVDKSLSDVVLPQFCVVAAIVRATEVIVPPGDEVLHEDDRLLVVSSKEAADEVEAAFGRTRPDAKRVMILGGEHVGFRLAQLLEKRGIAVKLIEPDPARSHEVAGLLARTEVVQGEGTDSEFLLDEGVTSTDAFIAATRDDEFNILIALLAKNLGAGRSLAVVERAQYVALAEAIGLDVVVSPLSLAAARVVRLVRSPMVVTLVFLAGSRVEAIEFSTGENARIANRRLEEVEMPQGAVIGAVVHGNVTEIPDNGTVVQPGDRVVVVCLPSVVPQVERLFE